MIIREMDKIKANIRQDGVAMTDFFGAAVKAGEKVSMGHAVFPPGTVVPPAAHSGDEYSYILSGKIKSIIHGKTIELHGGTAGFIPAGEVHSSVNDSAVDAEVIWMLVEKD